MTVDKSEKNDHLPKEHGVPAAQVVDLDGPVARIERLTYAVKGSEWTHLTIMIPSDHAHDQPSESVRISLSRRTLDRLLEALAWPT